MSSLSARLEANTPRMLLLPTAWGGGWSYRRRGANVNNIPEERHGYKSN